MTPAERPHQPASDHDESFVASHQCFVAEPLTDDIEEPPRPRSRRWRWRTKLLLLCGALALFAGGLLGWRYLSSYESTDDAQVDAHLYPISARIRGHVIRVKVDDNQYVTRG